MEVVEAGLALDVLLHVVVGAFPKRTYLIRHLSDVKWVIWVDVFIHAANNRLGGILIEHLED